MKPKGLLLFITLLLSSVTFAQDCSEWLINVNNAVAKAQHHMDSIVLMTEKPDYLETFLIYPVINRYYHKTKIRDTAFVRKYPDLARTVWCFKGTCFNNNKSFYLSKTDVADRIRNNDLKDSYQRETICMLCDKYALDTSEIVKLLDYKDMAAIYENANASNYALLHKSLQLANMKSQKCISKELFERYKFALTDTIYRSFVATFLSDDKKSAVIPSNAYDLFAEGILMISILDDKINISDDLYEQVIIRQLSDCGWSESDNITSSNGHSSIVSLWVLMDLQQKLRIITKKP